MANNPNNFMVVQTITDESQLLGKFLYYSLADVLVKKDDFERICEALNFPMQDDASRQWMRSRTRPAR